MARDLDAKCRQCRREGEKLFLKGEKCFTDRCAVERRGYAPGQHGQSTGRRRKSSEYQKQLREKQKVKRIYGLTERQFRNMFDRVRAESGVTGHNLMIALERRLDNIVYRMGFAASRRGARQLVRHRHVLVNGRLVDIPSYAVDAHDEVKLGDASRDLAAVRAALEGAARGAPVSWLAVDAARTTWRRPLRARCAVASRSPVSTFPRHR